MGTELYSNKVNILKALAIMIMVAGHLEFSLIPMFPPYSFQVMLFFFIAGMLFNEKYSFFAYFKRRTKTLMFPYFLYAAFYLVVTIAITPIIGKFWGMPVTIKNEFLMPFLTGHQIDLISPLWFVPCLFITLLIYKIFSAIRCSNILKLGVYAVLTFLAICFQEYAKNINLLWIFRTMFALLFVHLGYLYKNYVEGKINIFSNKIFYFVVILQSILWFANRDFTPMDGIGLHFLHVWGEYNNGMIAVITSITGIWMSLFIVEILIDKIKDWAFLQKIGQNTYHIMANHLFMFNILTYCFLALKGIPFDIKNNADIYWFYFPLKTTYFYFIFGLVTTVYIGEGLKFLRKQIYRMFKFFLHEFYHKRFQL